MLLIKKSLAGILIMVCFLFLAGSFKKSPSFSEEGKGKIMAFRELTLLPSTDTAELERFAQEQLTPTFRNKVPGVESYIIKGQRGDNKGQYVHLLIFDSERTRDFYFPYEHSGESEIQGEALSLWRPGQVMLLDSLPKYTKPLQENTSYTDYVFIEYLNQ